MRFLLGLLLLAVMAPLATADEKEQATRKKEAEKRLAKLPEYCKERRVTHLVELLAEWGEFADANHQDEVMLLGRALADDAKEEVGIKVLPRIGYRGTSATTNVLRMGDPSAYFVDEIVCTQSPNVRESPGHVLGGQLLVVARTVTARPNSPMMECMVFTNAAVSTLPALNQCLVVSSGSVDLDRDLNVAVVVCRGQAKFRWQEREKSLVRAGGAVTNIDAWRGKDAVSKPDPDKVFANDPKLLGVKFYSATEDGLEATADKGVVTVKAVDGKKAFAKAGVAKGDVIERVNGEPVPTLHELDRLLVRATVASGTARLKVKRDGKAQVIEVKLADW